MGSGAFINKGGILTVGRGKGLCGRQHVQFGTY